MSSSTTNSALRDRNDQKCAKAPKLVYPYRYPHPYPCRYPHPYPYRYPHPYPYRYPHPYPYPFAPSTWPGHFRALPLTYPSAPCI